MKKKLIALFIFTNLLTISFNHAEEIDVIVNVISCCYKHPELINNISRNMSDNESLKLKEEVLEVLQNNEKIHQRIFVKIGFTHPKIKKLINLWITHLWTRDNQSYAIYTPPDGTKYATYSAQPPPNLSPELAKILMRHSGYRCRQWQTHLNHKGEKVIKWKGELTPASKSVEVPLESTELFTALDQPLIVKGYVQPKKITDV